ncbi:MAG: hypothetical protein RLO50_22460 [Azospirillaceae bacterium]
MRSTPHRLPGLLALTLAAALACSPAQAQERTSGLRDLLAHFPAEIMESEEWADILYSDLQAARIGVSRDAETLAEAMFGDDRFVAPYMRSMGLPYDMVQGMSFGFSGEWTEIVGFLPRDIAQSLSYAAPPDQLAIIEMAESADFDAIAGALRTTGYTPEQRGDWNVLWYIEEDYRMNLADRDPRNPFGGHLGRSSRVALLEPLLAYSPAWPRIEAVTGGVDRSALELPAVLALLAVVDDPRHGEGRLVNVAFLTEQQPAEMRDGAPIPGVGIPAWELGLFADLSTGAVDTALAAFVYADAKTAGEAAAAIETVWSDTTLYGFHPSLSESGMPEIHVTGDGADQAVVVISIEREMTGDADTVYNLAYRAFYTGMISGELPVFGHP